jgi:hypothetical protein
VSDWYSHDVFLANDGDFLVRLGPWNSGSQPRKEDLAVAFYKEGRLLKSYSTAELMEDPKRVSRSVSHYEWRSSDAPYLGMGEFWITTIEGRLFVFDLATGKIKSARPAKN